MFSIYYGRVYVTAAGRKLDINRTDRQQNRSGIQELVVVAVVVVFFFLHFFFPFSLSLSPHSKREKGSVFNRLLLATDGEVRSRSIECSSGRAAFFV